MHTRVKPASSRARTPEASLERALAGADVCVWRWDPHTDKTVWSDACASLFGLPLGATLSYEQFRGILHPNDRDRVEAAVRRALAEGAEHELEYRVIWPDGAEHWIAAKGHVVPDSSGKPALMEGVALDITERKRAGTLLAGQKRVLEMIALGLPLPECLDAMLRVAESLAPGMLASILLCDTDSATLRHGAGPSLPAGYVAVLEGIPIGPIAGSCGTAAFRREQVIVTDIETDPLWQDIRTLGLQHGLRACWSTPIIGAKGALLGTFAMYYREARAPEPHHLQIIDAVTHMAAIAIERMQTEATLRRNERRLQAAQAQARVGSWELPLRGERGWWSQEMYRLLDRDPALGPLPFPEFLAGVHPEDRALIRDAHARIAAGSAVLEVEFRSNPTLGPLRHFVARMDCLRDAGGSPQALGGTLLDITERKRAEEERLRLEAQLRQAQKMEALGTLAGGIAHDFNNILAAISGNAQLALIDLSADNPARTAVAEIDRAAARAINLVRQILTFSRRDEAERRPLALRPVIEEALKLLRATLPAMIEIRAEYAAELPEVAADATQVHQILMNLGSNAAHAIGDRRGMLSLRLESAAVESDAPPTTELAPGRYARLSVSDDGCGMDQATLDRIFDPFFTTKAPGQGTGLGLSVVHGIMRSYGGAVVVESALGKGTTLHWYFPAAAEAAAAASGAAAPAAVHGRGEHVLYVDDEEALAFLAERMLKRLGFRVTAHVDAGQALQAFRANPQDFDLVVTDLAMPRMSGPDLARELLQVRPDVPIVLMSGYVRPEEVAAAKRLGVLEVFLKPNTIGELTAILDRLLRAKRKSRDSRTSVAPVNPAAST